MCTVSTSRITRRDMRDRVLTDGGDKWTVKLDVRTLVVILTPPFVAGLLLWLHGSDWLLSVWFSWLCFL